MTHPIRFHCPNCGKRLIIPQAHPGRKGKCPGCGTAIPVPKPVTDPAEQAEEGETYQAPTADRAPGPSPGSSPETPCEEVQESRQSTWTPAVESLQPAPFDPWKHAGEGLAGGALFALFGAVFLKAGLVPWLFLTILCGLIGVPVGIIAGYFTRKGSIARGHLSQYPQLAKAVEEGTADVAMLIQALASGDTAIRKVALTALAKLRRNAAPAVPALITELLKGAPPRSIPEDGCEICGKKLTVFTRHVGTRRCLACGNRLQAARNGENPIKTTAELAAEALGYIGPKAAAAIPALLVVKESKDPTLSDACDWALERIQNKPRPAK